VRAAPTLPAACRRGARQDRVRSAPLLKHKGCCDAAAANPTILAAAVTPAQDWNDVVVLPEPRPPEVEAALEVVKRAAQQRMPHSNHEVRGARLAGAAQQPWGARGVLAGFACVLRRLGGVYTVRADQILPCCCVCPSRTAPCGYPLAPCYIWESSCSRGAAHAWHRCCRPTSDHCQVSNTAGSDVGAGVGA
jgi:hypothetical protein